MTDYPVEHRHFGRGVAISLGLHVMVSALVCLIAYWLGIFSLRDLLSKGGSIAESGPAPEQQQIMVELVKEEILPPPTPNPLFIKQIIKPPIIPPVPPKPQPKPEPKPAPKPPPRFTAKNAQGAGKSQAVSQARVGTSGLPGPSYPRAAEDAGQEGTVGLSVVFGPDGSVASADVVQSSGYSTLDVYTRNFVYEHWKNEQLANQTVRVPVVYDLSRRSVH